MTPELRHSISQRARALQQRLNEGVHPVNAALEAKRVFEDAADAVRTRWLVLELGGYAEHVPARPLHAVLGVPSNDRLVAHVAAYRSQRGLDTTSGGHREFSHFFVEPLSDLVAARNSVAHSASETLLLEFGRDSVTPGYPLEGEFTRDVFERVVLGFVAALHLQLGTWA